MRQSQPQHLARQRLLLHPPAAQAGEVGSVVDDRERVPECLAAELCPGYGTVGLSHPAANGVPDNPAAASSREPFSALAGQRGWHGAVAQAVEQERDHALAVGRPLTGYRHAQGGDGVQQVPGADRGA